MQWYYSKAGTQLGPISQTELLSKIASGEVSASDLAWRDGLADWQPVSKIAELQSASPVVASSAVSEVGAPVSAPASVSPYTTPSAVSAGEKIPNYLWQSIAVTCLCCLPFGIPAIIFAAKVDGLQARGDIAGAQEASKKAKTWTLVSFIVGLVVIILYLVLAALGAAAAANGQLPQ